VIRVAGDRDKVLAGLHERAIGAGIHYPVPLHLQPAYRYLGIEQGALPHTERSAASCLSLPIFAELQEEQVGRVVGALKEALKG
jgi:dTDP-4-amino-4,6-dideoxygalactose transaminase